VENEAYVILDFYITKNLHFHAKIHFEHAVKLYSREETSELRLRESLENDAIDSKYGFERVADHLERTGFLINMHTVCII
jgi:hypothetical protein